MQQLKVCVVMPTYNNGGTLRDVVERVRAYCTDVIVVNDGCTDNSAEILASFSDRITTLEVKVTTLEGRMNHATKQSV